MSKSFGKRTVLDRVSLRVDPGRVVAVVGQNGSGKSTLLRIAAGLLAASSGAVFRAGAVGYCPQDRGLAGRLTVREHVELFAAGRTSAVDRVMTVLKELWIGPELDDTVASVSGGTQQKLNLALAVASDPDLLLLDEPYQALGVPASRMYQRDGGPTPENIVALLRRVSSDPDTDVRTSWDALIFNWLVDNPSAHARQYALLLEKTTVRLAPLYGLRSQLPYQESRRPFSIGKTTSAMAFRNSRPFTKIPPPWAWVLAVQSPGLPKKEVIERVVDLSLQVPNAIKEAAEDLPSDLRGNVTAAKLVEGVQRHAKGRERLAWLWSKLREVI